MVDTPAAAGSSGMRTTPRLSSRDFTYDHWMESRGIPVHKGYYIEDVRTVEVGWWEERQQHAAFIQLAGQEGVSEARVTEIPPTQTLPPLKFALDEVVYVASGRGITTVWEYEGGPKKTFEWHPHSLFLLPRNCFHQHSNMQGDQPVRLLHYSYLPLAMSTISDPDFFFGNPYQRSGVIQGGNGDFYSEALAIRSDDENALPEDSTLWYGNFFPDMQAWDRLDPLQTRGAGGRRVMIEFPRSEMSCHMSVFPSRTYKKAHRHGPGRVIIIPGGEGFSILWQEGKEKVVVPWHEASLFVPPNRWFHQHFNVGGTPARYLALHPPFQFHGYSERVEDRARDQIEYPAEDQWIREMFAEELGKRGLTSLMPAQAYQQADYEWKIFDQGGQ